MTENLPDEVQYGFVYGKTLLAIGDTTDDVDRFPDGVAAKGIVRFTPKVTILRTETDPATIIKQRIECKIHQGKDDPDDPDPAKVGLLVDTAGHVGNVALVVGQYDVSYQLEGGASVPSFTINVTPEHTPESPLDLALAAPIVPSPTVKFVVNEQVYLDTLAARDEAEAARDEAVTAAEDAVTAADSAKNLSERFGRRHPKTPLRFGAPIESRSLTILARRTLETPPGIAYGIDHGWIARTDDGWVTKVNGRGTVSAQGWEHGLIRSFVGWADGSLCLITDSAVLTMESISAPPQVTLEISTPLSSGISANFYESGTDRIVTFGEYNHDSTQKKLYVSRDGGESFEHVRTTEPTVGGNNHWHATAYDPWANALWAAAGDNSVPPRELSYSTDWGKTWNSLTADDSRHLQPTLIWPFPRRVVFARDAGGIKPGLDQLERPPNRQLGGEIPLSLGLLEFAGHNSAADLYLSTAFVAVGRTSDELYVSFPRRATEDGLSYIWATGDGGSSWHLVYSGDEEGLLQSDGERLFIASATSPRVIRSGPLLDWEWTPLI